MGRNAELMRLLDAEAHQYAIWNDSEEAEPSGEYWAAVDDLLDGFAADPGDGVLAWSASTVDKLRAAYAEFNESGMALPAAKYWRLRGEVQDACRRTPPVLDPLPTISTLVSQKVPGYQICRIWRLFGPGGHEDVQLVQDELDRPGSVITPAHIEYVNGMRLIEAGWLAGDAGAKKKTAKAPERAAAPDDIETLIRQRVPVQQILKIKREQYGESFPPNIITDLADHMGISVPGSADAVLNKAYADLTRERTQVEPPLPSTLPPIVEGEINEGDGMDLTEADGAQSVEDRVIDLYEGGHDVKTIASNVGLGEKKVRAIIKNYAAAAVEGDEPAEVGE